MTVPTCARFDEPACAVAEAVGGKALGLARMAAEGLPVAPGFAVTTAAYRRFLDHDGLRDRLTRMLHGVDLRDPAVAERAADEAAATLHDRALPPEVEAEVARAYARLCTDVGRLDVPVAVRSSATAEDSDTSSFAGEFETWLDVVGPMAVAEHVLACYASVFSARAMTYAARAGLHPTQVEMAVVVQKVVRARAAGVLFTINPVSGDRSKIVAEASWGLGLAVVGGEVTPDRYVVDKVGLRLSARQAGDKHIEYRNGHHAVDVEPSRRTALCLDDGDVLEAAALGLRLERLHGHPQDVEFAVDDDLPAGQRVVLLQCRPETVWSAARRAPVFDAGQGVAAWVNRSILDAATGRTVAGNGHEHG